MTTVGKVGTGATVLVWGCVVENHSNLEAWLHTDKHNNIWLGWLRGRGEGGSVPGELACELHVEEDRCGLCGVHWIHREGAMP